MKSEFTELYMEVEEVANATENELKSMDGAISFLGSMVHNVAEQPEVTAELVKSGMYEGQLKALYEMFQAKHREILQLNRQLKEELEKHTEK